MKIPNDAKIPINMEYHDDRKYIKKEQYFTLLLISKNKIEFAHTSLLKPIILPDHIVRYLSVLIYSDINKAYRYARTLYGNFSR